MGIFGIPAMTVPDLDQSMVLVHTWSGGFAFRAKFRNLKKCLLLASVNVAGNLDDKWFW